MKKFLTLVAVVMLGLCALTGCRKMTLEKSAKPLVTEIISEQLGGSAKCTKVKITDKIDDKHYRATAKLDNGNDIQVIIEDRGDMVYVSIPLLQ